MRGNIIVAVLAVALLAAACGDDGSGAEPAPTPTVAASTTITVPPTTTTGPPRPGIDLDAAAWSQVADGAPWGGRAGLRLLSFDDALFVLGGRTPNESTIPGDSRIWDDVWRSDDAGATWALVAPATDGEHWPARAYFQAVVLGEEMFVIGGQDFGLDENPFCELLEQGLEPPSFVEFDPDAPCPPFIPSSSFFDDVWASTDGITWEQRTDNAPWTSRAGLSAVALDGWIYVMGGSKNDDRAIIGPNGPVREYFNDVWRTQDGVDWERMTGEAPWEPRAGASVVAHDGEIWLFGGEDGFTCEPLPDCDAPYYNDVWRSADGAEWTLVADSAGWSPRPGHQCERLEGQFVCFGGFGLVENPTDVWVSDDGATWFELAGPPWNASAPEAVRYDFDSEVVGSTIVTAGGDRETFDFEDPENYLRIEDDVWTFGLP